MKIKSLTKADILDKINNKNISQIFLKERTIQRDINIPLIFLNISIFPGQLLKVEKVPRMSK
jgi:hypothetical protein